MRRTRNKKISRDAALQKGALRYFTGRPCRHGHIAERLVGNFGCVMCKRATQRRWTKKFPEKHVAHVVLWAKRHPKKKAAINQRYWSNNPTARLRMALKRKFGVTLEQYQTMLKVQKNRCAICRRHVQKLTRGLAVDHCHITNKVRALLCHTCNQHLGIYELHKSKFEAYLQEYGS